MMCGNDNVKEELDRVRGDVLGLNGRLANLEDLMCDMLTLLRKIEAQTAPGPILYPPADPEVVERIKKLIVEDRAKGVLFTLPKGAEFIPAKDGKVVLDERSTGVSVGFPEGSHNNPKLGECSTQNVTNECSTLGQADSTGTTQANDSTPSIVARTIREALDKRACTGDTILLPPGEIRGDTVRVPPDNTPPGQWTEAYCIYQSEPDINGFRQLRLGIFSFTYGQNNVLGHFRLRFDKATGKLLALEDFSVGYGHLKVHGDNQV